jgi:hypothetical protein
MLLICPAARKSGKRTTGTVEQVVREAGEP